MLMVQIGTLHQLMRPISVHRVSKVPSGMSNGIVVFTADEVSVMVSQDLPL